MPYLVSSIITVVAAMVILLTRYEADDSAIMSQIEKMKTMVSMVDGYVNTYIESGGILSDINFEVLQESGILLEGSTLTPVADTDPSTGEIETTMSLPNDDVIWHIIPNKLNADSYKLLVDFTGDSSLMSKSRFSEGFIGREYCEKMLFGELLREQDQFDGTDDFENDSGSNDDGRFVCIVYK
jgi:hypothetical protein